VESAEKVESGQLGKWQVKDSGFFLVNPIFGENGEIGMFGGLNYPTFVLDSGCLSHLQSCSIMLNYPKLPLD
jgi:hypothetical protein